MISEDSYDEISHLLGKAQDQLMRDEGLSIRQSWAKALDAVSGQIGISVEELNAGLRKIRANRISAEPPILWESRLQPKNQADLQRREWWRKEPQLFEVVLLALFTHDPIGICQHGAGTVEYSLETNTILPRVLSAASESEVATIVKEEFGRWFGRSADAGMEKCARAATEIWEFLRLNEHK